MTDNSPQLPQFPGDDSASVPVFNCHVIVSPPDESGRQTARVANLAAIEASGFGEREILMAVTRQFKSLVAELTAEGTPIPWREPPESPGPDESERFVPVHL